jgi:hypothetical protein
LKKLSFDTADRAGESNKFNDVDPPFTHFYFGNERWRLSDASRQIALRQPVCLTGLDQEVDGDLVRW